MARKVKKVEILKNQAQNAKIFQIPKKQHFDNFFENGEKNSVWGLQRSPNDVWGLKTCQGT